jgi:DNA-binding NarL/FixJ family response regulator
MTERRAIRVGLANGHFLVRNGLSTLLSSHPVFMQIFAVSNEAELLQAILHLKADVLILDAYSQGFSANTLRLLKQSGISIPVLHITNAPDRQAISDCMRAGINNHILANCDEQEIEEALLATVAGRHFLCGRIAEILNGKQGISTCNGVVLTEREREIIAMIAEGFSNKEIADKLFLSTHTVNTHRKNIMNKLEVNNTAGLVMYAVREQILSPNHFLFS